MKQRVVICRSNPIAPDPRVEKEARTLSQAGYDLTLLGWDRSASLPRQGDLDGMRVVRLPIRAEYATGMHNLPDLLRWQLGLLRWLRYHRRDYDLIHACDFDTILPALICRGLYSKKVIYDIFDFYADHLRLTPGFIKQAIRAVDLHAINRADALILVDDSRYEQIQGSRPQRSAVIYNSPEDIPAEAKPDETGKPDVAHPHGSSLNIVYIGLLQVERGLFELLTVLRRHPDWSLDLAGFGGDEARLVKLAEDMPNVSWHGRVPYPRAIELSSAADVLIATYDPSIPNHRYSSPNKVFEAMMLGKPVVVAQDTNMDRIIQHADCGLVVPYGDVSALEAALLQLRSDRDLRLRLGENARNAYDTTYSWQIMADRLLRLYKDVLG